MGILYEDILENLSLLNPQGKVLEVQETTDNDLTLSYFSVRVSRPVLHFVEDIFKLSHSSNFLVKEWTHQILLSYCQFISL